MVAKAFNWKPFWQSPYGQALKEHAVLCGRAVDGQLGASNKKRMVELERIIRDEQIKLRAKFCYPRCSHCFTLLQLGFESVNNGYPE